MIRTITQTQIDEIAGAAVPAAVAFAGGIVAAHYGEKALDAFDEWAVSKYEQFNNWAASQIAYAFYDFMFNPCR